MSPRPRFVLASQSPARLSLLRAAGLDPEVVVSGVAEDVDEPLSAPDTVLLLAGRKARVVADQLDGEALVLGCDSMLELDGAVLGKPESSADAVTRWESMRGRSGVLHTGHCLIDVGGRRAAEDVASTVVRFADLSDDEVAAYVATGEPLAVAGAFTIDGLGGPFVERIEGDWSAVVGVSLPLLRRLTRELGVAWHTLWADDGSTS